MNRLRLSLVLGCLVVSCTDGDGAAGAGVSWHVRVANLSVEASPVRVCSGADIGASVGVSAIAYAQITGYLPIAGDELRIRVVAGTGACDGPALVERTFGRNASPWRSLVVFGDPASADRPLDIALLDDEIDAPRDPSRAKARTFHTDTQAPAIDVGLLRPDGTRTLLFGSVAYGHLASSTHVGALDAGGYVDGLAVPLPAPKLFVWSAGGDRVLGWFPGAAVPFRSGKTYSVFPAGRVAAGTAEVVICEDAPTLATSGTPLMACARARPMTGGDPGS